MKLIFSFEIELELNIFLCKMFVNVRNKTIKMFNISR